MNALQMKNHKESTINKLLAKIEAKREELLAERVPEFREQLAWELKLLNSQLAGMQ
jgi:hypothetical protein